MERTDYSMGNEKQNTELKDKTEYYETEAQTYDETRSKKMKFLWETQLRMVCDLCGNIEGKELLEVGVGTGRFSIELGKKDANITSLDPANAMLRITKEKSYVNNINKISLIRGYGNNLPFKDESFDGVICLHVLNQLSVYGDILKEMWRVTKQNGFIIVNFPNPLSFYLPSAICTNMYHAFEKDAYNGFFTKHKAKETLENVGFTIEELRGNIFLHPKYVPERLHSILSKIENYTSHSFLKNFSGYLFIKARKKDVKMK